jgi:hypothetical protein
MWLLENKFPIPQPLHLEFSLGVWNFNPLAASYNKYWIEFALQATKFTANHYPDDIPIASRVVSKLLHAAV